MSDGKCRTLAYGKKPRYVLCAIKERKVDIADLVDNSGSTMIHAGIDSIIEREKPREVTAARLLSVQSQAVRLDAIFHF